MCVGSQGKLGTIVWFSPGGNPLCIRFIYSFIYTGRVCWTRSLVRVSFLCSFRICQLFVRLVLSPSLFSRTVDVKKYAGPCLKSGELVPRRKISLKITYERNV